ncbi:FKBP-type peptidyl-prolyl cis-trans isomerase FkpA [Enterovibrio norvegicus FF-33]|uniref:Peptidyl-prolyl cis-trans isomerase n=1 Tax=Enterovibrio norvegicus FF-454 TaxID=1185651 RepID=A0A1E5CG90_9GAMM|nr:FKBP-type peptidyl-prolyl cis-trans isomerase [Enterovibrio norvegicus]OEE64485.1 FKBP-type peptidyl-prolyl cis-trans isomerase FkpA [Enterovibrio norvegicus FF-454]OEE68874.1 FKBP-type peptidyl-prolyl cis-trans isomerase FkpA [Enterovibrio norvegicus FF-33]OEE88288.1 FKBP-type peptidyl-prolyl cis-trans isomerase FkpA [Enterovibrio norvegicus FF-162]
MKSVFKMSLLAATVALAVGCQEDAKEETVKVEAPVAVETVTFATEDDKAAYAIGASLAQYLKANLEQQQEIGLALSSDLVLQGVQDAFADQSKLSEEEAQVALQALDQRVAEMAQKQSQEKAAVAVKAGDEYRTQFAKTDGVTTTDSGLMYMVEKMGDGEKPAAEDTVVVHYKGTLTDGTQFDSSYDRNQPATFPLNRVIPGWTEGVQLMPVGSKFKFVIPSELAYGSQDTPAIPANSTLVFDVELLEIKGKPAAN